MAISDYIPRQAVLDYLYQAIQDEPNDGVRLGYVRAKSVIGSMPEADVVEVVRCQNCKYRGHFCTRPHGPDDWFCADGERKDGKGDG